MITERIIGYIVVAVVAVAAASGAVWYVQDLLQAKTERKEAQEANKTLVEDKKATKAKADKIDNTLVNRQNREDVLARRVEELENAMRKAESNPAVKSWGDTTVPDDLVLLRAVQSAGTGDKGGEAGMQPPGKPDRPRPSP